MAFEARCDPVATQEMLELHKMMRQDFTDQCILCSGCGKQEGDVLFKKCSKSVAFGDGFCNPNVGNRPRERVTHASEKAANRRPNALKVTFSSTLPRRAARSCSRCETWDSSVARCRRRFAVRMSAFSMTCSSIRRGEATVRAKRFSGILTRSPRHTVGVWCIAQPCRLTCFEAGNLLSLHNSEKNGGN